MAKRQWYLEPFGFTIYLMTKVEEIKNPKVLYKFLMDLAKEPKPAGVCHMDDDKEGAYILILPDENADSAIYYIDTVAHEVFHAICYLYEAIEDETKLRDVEEVPAYLQGWITGEILRALGYK